MRIAKPRLTSSSRVSAENQTPKYYKILLAYREHSIRHSLKEHLDAAGGYRTLAVDSARASINALLRGSSDLLITGMDLLDSDGWRLLRMVRSGRFCSATLPVVMVCNDYQITLATPLAQEYDVCLFTLSNAARLPATVAQCIQGSLEGRPSLLVIEDDEHSARLAELSLGHQFTVELADDGETGLAAWRTRQHNLVLLDVMLPGLSGPEVLRHILNANPTQAIIIITAYATQERHQELMLAGATEFIAKPFDVRQLRELCARILRHSAYLSLDQGIRIREAMNQRVWAAHRCLSSGRTALAAYHLRQALAASADSPPTDDEWIQLLSEFD